MFNKFKKFFGHPLAFDIIIGVSLVFLILVFDPKLGPPFLAMWLTSLIIRMTLPSKILVNNISNNTVQSIMAAGAAFVLFFLATFLITNLFQGAAFVQGTIDIESPIQSIMRHGFIATGLSTSQPIFADSVLLTYYTFGFIVPFIETVFLISLFEALTKMLNISLERFSIFLAGIYILLGGLFVWLHANVKGVEDNVALIMTFIFALFTFELVRRGNSLFKKLVVANREKESAIWLHVLNNVTFIFNRIGL